MTSVVRSRDWRDRLIQYPALMAEVMECMARKEVGEGVAGRAGVRGGAAGPSTATQAGSPDPGAGPANKRAKRCITPPVRFPNN